MEKYVLLTTAFLTMDTSGTMELFHRWTSLCLAVYHFVSFEQLLSFRDVPDSSISSPARAWPGRIQELELQQEPDLERTCFGSHNNTPDESDVVINVVISYKKAVQFSAPFVVTVASFWWNLWVSNTNNTLKWYKLKPSSTAQWHKTILVLLVPQ